MRDDEQLLSFLQATDRDDAAASAGVSQQRAAQLIFTAIRDGSASLDEFLDTRRRTSLRDSWARHGTDRLGPVKHDVDGVSWVDVRVSQLMVTNGVDLVDHEHQIAEARRADIGAETTSESAPTPSGPEIRIGQKVRIIKDPTRTGIVLQSQSDGSHRHHQVFLSANELVWFDEDDLRPIPQQPPLLWISLEGFLRRLALTKLTSRFSDIFYSYRASRTNFEVYQFKPVLKFIGMDTPGLLIADEVGLGKTIEAAIIYLEMKARADLQRVLVVCPAGLTRKWQSELLLRFDEDFAIMNKTLLLAFINNYHATEGNLPLRAIISLEAIRDDNVRELLTDAGITFDLVIFDEAHHLRNRGTKSHEIAESLSNLATRSLLLTATPLQTHEQDLFNLLQLIAPGEFPDYNQFELQLRPNAHLNRAIQMLGQAPPQIGPAVASLESLKTVPYTDGIVRNPLYAQVLKRLRAGDALQPRDVVTVRRNLQLLNTISHVYTRTKKKDVTGVAKREATTIEVELTSEERAFYDAVIDWVRASSRSAVGNWGVLGFNLINRERQAASCMPAAREYLQDLLANDHSRLEIESTDPSVDVDATPNISPQSAVAVNRLLEAADAIKGVDSKYRQLKRALDDALASDPHSKVIIFSFFKRTLRYLEEQLRRDGFAPLVITGDVKPEERARRLDEFRGDPQRQLLLSSEVGAEGLDFQFADTIVNYDLPWNPMRVEQRIGRIDRYGQVRSKVFIINLILKDTIESRILARLYDRINVFEEAVGDLEPILGDVISYLTRSLFVHELSVADEIELAHQVDLRISEKEKDLEQFESKQAELMGEDQLFERAVEDRVGTGRFVSPNELIALVEPWLNDRFPRTDLRRDPEDATWSMKGDADLGAHLHQAKYGQGGRDPEGRTFLQRMMAGKIVPLTFDPQLASARKRVELIHPRHPLAQAAVDHWRGQLAGADVDAVAALSITSDDASAGTYDFFLFKLDVQAVNPALTFEPVALRLDGEHDREASRILLRLLVSATGHLNEDQDRDRFEAQRQRATAIATAVRSERESEAISHNEALLSLRAEAIGRAEDAKRRRAEEVLTKVGDPSIRRMKEREIENIEASRRARLAALDAKRSVLVSIQEVAAGRLTVVSPQQVGDPPSFESELHAPQQIHAARVVGAPRTRAPASEPMDAEAVPHLPPPDLSRPRSRRGRLDWLLRRSRGG